jgi:N-methylhydantoinase B/oxoprolinase/acetone carboxylase alpha subunit
MYFVKNLFTSEQMKNQNIQEEKAKRRARLKEEERLRKLNRNEWEVEYDEYLDWYEKEEAREEMMRNIDAMTSKPNSNECW